ncbi:MAG: hypothetical protein HXX15_21080 [Rhodopseudomonas sp.]|uniref:hypothetical protein n=1 Tax=Rhodopseudomonas sp. TaxID=1078 RepID=UPI00182D1124|nr:hypothetical protein [Rhodopseudomonas sp.]NVN88582.1 hypothetical protein [Rhodopseudomonas sp.]
MIGDSLWGEHLSWPNDLNTEAATRKCATCGADMTHLADLPARQLTPATRIWRCFHCSNVVSESF